MESGTIVNSLRKLIIEERKADHKASVERWRRQNLVSPDSKRFGLRPLEIFPREVWELIFERLTDPAAIAGAWNACPFFQEVIGRDKYFSHSLFPAVLSLEPLKDALRAVHSRGFGWEESRRYVSKLRLVSKTWKQGVDQLVIREIEEYNAWPCTSEYYSWFPFFHMTSDVIEKQLLDASLNNMGNGRRSVSIVNHSLDLTPSNHRELVHRNRNREFVQGFLSKLNRFLVAFGGDVLRLRLATTPDWTSVSGLTARDYYLMIRTWISHTPRLKCLEMSLSRYHEFGEADAALLEVQEAIRSHPFPCLNHLRSLELKGAPAPKEKFVLALYTAILNSNKQIEQLKIELDCVRNDSLELNGHMRTSIHALENLQSLHVFVESLPFYFSQFPDDPTPCFNLNWKLKRLSLAYGVTLSSQLFRLLENYPTLEWLQLDLFLKKESRFDSFLHLPNVTTVILSVNNAFGPSYDEALINIDFLFPMKKLSVLKWRGTWELPYIVDATNELIEFQRGRCDLHRSNIWDVFPFLSQIEIFGSQKVYKRGLRV